MSLRREKRVPLVSGKVRERRYCRGFKKKEPFYFQKKGEPWKKRKRMALGRAGAGQVSANQFFESTSRLYLFDIFAWSYD